MTVDPITAQFVARPQPLYMIGDSHCLIFKDLLFKEQASQQMFVTRTKYCPGLAAHNMVDAKGNLNNTLLHALYMELLLIPNGQQLGARHLVQTPYAEDFSKAIDSQRSDPHLVFFLGELDLRVVFLKQAEVGSDFNLPHFLEHHNANLALLPPIQNRKPIPFELILEFASPLLKPLFTGLEQLRKFGFKNLSVHSLPPQTLDDREYEKKNHYHCPALLRYKATLVFNWLLAEQCRRHGIHFLDIWPEVTTHDLLNPDYYLDGQHLNKKACFMTVQKLLEQVCQQTSSELTQHD